MKQTVIVDTGSHVTAFPCIGCVSCGSHSDKYFDYNKSTTSRVLTCDEGISCNCEDNKCKYYQSYMEGSSISGYLVEDYIIFGDDFDHAHNFLAIFGCHTRETHLFKTQYADGIMGIGPKNQVKTIIEYLYDSELLINSDVFSICLGKTDGFMTIGGYNSSMHNTEIK